MIDFNDDGPQGGGKRNNVTELPTVRKERVERQAKARIREFIRYLFPRAKLGSDEARIGDINGHPGLSLSISLANDESAGRWKDWATGERGDLFHLWGLLHGIDANRNLPKAVEEIDQWLGGAPPAKAEARHKEEAAKPPEPEPAKTLERTHVYKDKTGRKVAEVRRYTLSNGRKTFLPYLPNGAPGMPSPRTLYNLEHWHMSEAVVLVEGEKCADALHSIGVDATSLMGGADTTIAKTDLTPLAGKLVVLWPDNDEPGFSLMEKLDGPLRALGCTVRHVRIPADKPHKWDVADALEDGETDLVFALLKAPPASPLPLLDVAGLLSVPDPTWIINGWVIDDGVSVFYGPPKTYKTFNVLDMALSVACGVAWRGNAVVQKPVLYLLGEGMGTFKYRVHVWLQKRSEGRTPQFWTIPIGVPLGSPEGLANAMAAIDSLPVKPGLIVVDTLNRHFGPGDENSSQDMTRFIQSVDAIRHATRAHICLVHHSGKDAEKGARGSSALLGAVDNEFRVTRTEGTQICRIECTAARHSDEPKPMTVELVKVEAIHPVTGEVMSSLLPVLRDDGDAPPNMPPSSPLILKALEKAEMTIKELEDETALSRSRLSTILPILERLKVISSYAEGKAKIYYLPTSGAGTSNPTETEA